MIIKFVLLRKIEGEIRHFSVRFFTYKITRAIEKKSQKFKIKKKIKN